MERDTAGVQLKVMCQSDAGIMTMTFYSYFVGFICLFLKLAVLLACINFAANMPVKGMLAIAPEAKSMYLCAHEREFVPDKINPVPGKAQSAHNYWPTEWACTCLCHDCTEATQTQDRIILDR